MKLKIYIFKKKKLPNLNKYSESVVFETVPSYIPLPAKYDERQVSLSFQVPVHDNISF